MPPRGHEPHSDRHQSDSRERATLRRAMALTVLDDAAHALSRTYHFPPARCRQLILQAARIELDRINRQ